MKTQIWFVGFMLLFTFMSQSVTASSPNFNNVTSDDFAAVMKDFSALSSYTSVSGASGRGSLFGFEVGLIGSLTSTPNVNSVAQKTDSSISIPQMPNAGVLAALSIPMGLSFEFVFLPKNSINGLSYSQYGGAVQYKLLDFPVNVSLKGHYTKTEFSFSEVLKGANASVNFDDAMYGADVMVGKDLIFIEPYVGLGYVTANANLGVTGTSNSIYDPSFTASQTANSTPSSSRVIIGVNFKLLLISIGAEYLRSFDTNRYNFKLSAGF